MLNIRSCSAKTLQFCRNIYPNTILKNLKQFQKLIFNYIHLKRFSQKKDSYHSFGLLKIRVIKKLIEIQKLFI
ncbi:hypothetical protein BpHYR1_036293 [Brachionus plicatilis]|uniref:Uncharacterized protein n=1 Tax=Brachionus plicatilis TaxID=10195 RepID=A0A3M7PXZ3_BRAPC|nr:hypothetical protein BpHYR1_036293 [Brachionus plicatilis]